MKNLRTILAEEGLVRTAVSDRAMQANAKKEALRWFLSSPLGRMDRDARVTSVRISPDSHLIPDPDYEVMYRVGIKTSGNHKRQINVILDSETGDFRGASDVERW